MIGIIAAMEEELTAVTAIMQDVERINVSGIMMVKGTLNKTAVIVMLSGVGKGNAAMSTTILLEHFDVKAIVNVGTAGGLKKEQRILDAVVSERVVQHDFDSSPIDGDAGYGLFFDADVKLVEICKKTLETLKVRAHCGLIASGDQFIAEPPALKRLLKHFPTAICAEMEAGAVAQICTHYHVPFVVLRSLSDITQNKDSHMDYQTYVQHAADRSAAFCKEFVALLS